MIEIAGKYNTAICYADDIEESAREQIKCLCDRPEHGGSNIRIMPDVHAGKGCTIGTTMTIGDKVVPNMVGVDIGCGMEVAKIENE
ncbi:MAG: RtcB family protein [Clostridiales Family XIII bacterium]|jgi:RNA-splicing ligase RtcB|nr:RtcB family protein [Clostridiales Family XIII bacterium]